MGDRVDMRVLSKIADDVHGVTTVEFASWLRGPSKFTSDHKKVLRESKVILDNIINREYTNKKEPRRLMIPCFQVSGLDGELKVLKLSTPELYTVQYIGSIPIPDHVADLSLLRKKCLLRLFYIKVNWLKKIHFSNTILNKKTRIMLSRMLKCWLSHWERRCE
jgi:hypothetical protein